MASFNGFYAQHGVFVMPNQVRVLVAEVVVLLVVLGGCWVGVAIFQEAEKMS